MLDRVITSFDRKIAILALPALGSLAAEPIYLLVDTAIVGHLGVNQLAALAVAGMLLGSGFWLFNFLAYGTTAQVARLHGAGRPAEAGRIAAQALWLALGIGVGLIAVGLLVAEPLVYLMGARGAVAEKALTYLRISLLGAPFVMIALAGQGYLRGVQNMMSPLRILVASNVLNVVLEIWFVYGLDWDIAGSAWGTVVAQAVAGGFFARALWQSAADSRRPSWLQMRKLVQLGGDLFVRTAALLMAFNVATAVLTRTSPAAVAAHQVVFQMFLFIALTLDAVAIAAQTLIGSALGASDMRHASALARRITLWGVAGGLVFTVLLAASSEWLPAVFTDSNVVLTQIDSVWLLFVVTQPINAVFFVLDGVLMGAGDTRYLKWSMLFAAFVVFVPLAVLALIFEWGLVGIWASLVAFFCARLATNVWRVAGGKWRVSGPVG